MFCYINKIRFPLQTASNGHDVVPQMVAKTISKINTNRCNKKHSFV